MVWALSEGMANAAQWSLVAATAFFPDLAHGWVMKVTLDIVAWWFGVVVVVFSALSGYRRG